MFTYVGKVSVPRKPCPSVYILTTNLTETGPGYLTDTKRTRRKYVVTASVVAYRDAIGQSVTCMVRDVQLIVYITNPHHVR